jgi:hypothetical protein
MKTREEIVADIEYARKMVADCREDVHSLQARSFGVGVDADSAILLLPKYKASLMDWERKEWELKRELAAREAYDADNA